MSQANCPIFNGIRWRLIGLGNADENVYPSKKSTAPPVGQISVQFIRVNFWKISDGVNGLETKAEAAYRGLVLGALCDVSDASDVGHIERIAEM